MEALAIMDTMRTLLAQGRKLDAARLLPELTAAVTGEAVTVLGSFPVCAACHGYAEVPHPSEANRKVSCLEYPDLCPGNKQGRMSPEQFSLYVAETLKDVVVPEASAPEPVRVADDVKPTRAHASPEAP